MSQSSRLKALKRLLGHVRACLATEIGFVLWDGSSVPDHLAPDALAIAIADEATIAALIRRPTLDTLANLWVSGRLDLRNGSIFDLVARRPAIRTRNMFKSLNKGLLLWTLPRFAFLSRGGPWPLEQIQSGRVGATENSENIHYHYDVSNAFYALFLDPEMVYSCGYFTDWSNDIARAQHDKLDMICRKLRLKPGERFLDIGCGWGALVCHAARHYGVKAHGVTLSQQQFDLARDKVARLGLQAHVTLELRDYMRLDGTFDKVASIGMFEHVGISNHADYFATVNRLLAPGGLYLHHAITRSAKRDDRRFKRKSAEHQALVRYIFPGGELDHVGMSIANLQRHGFEVHDVEAWREHYARTCRLWHDRLFAQREAAERAVGSVKTRLWLIYLAGCSLAFARNTVGIFQTLASKRVNGPSGLPPTRADLYR